MNEPVLLPNLRAEDGSVSVLSPAVGWWSRHPHAGELVGPGTRVGILEYQNRRFGLVLPDGARGRVRGELPRDRIVAVQYGEVLFRLAAVQTGEEVELAADVGTLGQPAGASLPEGARAVVSPTDGVFYAKPSPEAAPFVRVGDRVRQGQPVGLVEVMKTFNQITYGGPGFPPEADVLEIRAADATEVRAGDVLVVLR